MGLKDFSVLMNNYMTISMYELSGKFSVRQVQREVVKIKKKMTFPTGLEAHLEDMF